MSKQDLIQQQHYLFQQCVQAKYLLGKRKKEAEETRDHSTDEGNKLLEQIKQSGRTRLAQIKQVHDDSDFRIRDTEWRDRYTGGQPSTVINSSGTSLNQDIERCHTTVQHMSQEISTFLQNHEKPSSVSGNAGCLATIVGSLLCVIVTVLVSAATSASGSGSGGWVVGFVVALFAGIILFAARTESIANRLRTAYATQKYAASKAEELFKLSMKQPEANHKQRLQEIRADYEATITQANLEYQAALGQLRPAFQAFQQAVAAINWLGTSWQDQSWQQWKPQETPVLLSPLARLGTLYVPDQAQLSAIPALVACPGKQNLLLVASGKGKEQATQAVRSLMLHLLANLPPGKVRFTLIDPVGLGKNVDIFMQLADEEYDKKLVNERAWTEQRQIEQRLSDLSEEIVNIGQKYLRGQFKTIEAYNEDAKEVEEPYRVLVVIGFPVNFSDDMARNLVRIAENGPNCGVSTIVVMDEDQPSLLGFNIEDLKRVSSVISWNGSRFVWEDDDFRDMYLNIDILATDTKEALDRYNTIIKAIGSLSKAASEVKVPFEKIEPPKDRWWKNEEWWKDSSINGSKTKRDGFSVPLGRAGTKLQLMEIGKRNSTAHHALIAGKTGSGKTTLMHVLITSLMLNYSPDEVELYLVDFKTVGFTPYTTIQLPHIRIVAVQSEREFGLSVLRKMDDELVHRKNLFSQAGIDDFNKYREARPKEHMPRILLIVDEFQEFFTEEDDIARNATMYLERLVRQGRGLGLHIMLGSQSLAGTARLPVATLGQIDIRIAMSCELQDARLILSEDNLAARLLSRPGEAIYNATNGLEGGNSKFQCAWLSAEELKDYLKRLQQYAQQPQNLASIPEDDPVVFDGNTHADITANRALHRQLLQPSWPDKQNRRYAWIGEPISIKEPTTACFQAQAGNNFLLIGQQEEVTMGMFVTTLLSMAAQHAPTNATFYVADFSPLDAPHARLLEQVCAQLPHSIKMINRRNMAEAIGEIAQEVQKRIAADERSQNFLYLFIYGMQRARDLRPEEDFSFSSFGSTGEPPLSPAKQFTMIVREGPDLNVHTIAWCDTLTNLNRSLERGALREFEMRVALQMSTEDSMNLIDSPLANKLGPYRALFYSEDSGRAEKIRPYRVPSPQWLQEAISSIQRKQTQ